MVQLNIICGDPQGLICCLTFWGFAVAAIEISAVRLWSCGISPSPLNGLTGLTAFLLSKIDKTYSEQQQQEPIE